MQHKQIFIEKNNNSELTCRVDAIRLHSKYNPKIEAERNIEQQLSEKLKDNAEPQIVIMIGAGLGYELDVIKNKFPNVAILPIYFDQTLFDKNDYRDKALFLDTHDESFSQNLKSFLQKYNLSKLKQSDVLVLFWPPSTYIWKEATLNCLKEVKDIINLYLAEEKTIQHFIAQWIRNASFHYLHIANWHLPETVDKDIVVIGAGPSLNNYINEIQAKRSHFALLAVSSALKCLFENDIYPDIIVHQDSGFYASQYLTDFPKSYTPYIAFPLHASRSSLLRKYPSIILNTGQEIEGLLNISYMNTQSIHISPHATVIASALELAWKLTTKKIYLAGFDLNIDERGNHCFPHFQDKINELTRLKSFDNQIITKLLEAEYRNLNDTGHKKIQINQNRSLKIYSDWFKRWNPSDKLQRSIILTDSVYPHQENMTISHKLESPKPVNKKHKTTNNLKSAKPDNTNKRQHKLHFSSKRVSKFDKTKRKEELTQLVSNWEHTWKQIKSENQYSVENQANISKHNTSHNVLETIKTLQNTISEEVFHNIVSSVKNYLK